MALKKARPAAPGQQHFMLDKKYKPKFSDTAA
jgi:hypothetical protein